MGIYNESLENSSLEDMAFKLALVKCVAVNGGVLEKTPLKDLALDDYMLENVALEIAVPK